MRICTQTFDSISGYQQYLCINLWQKQGRENETQ